MIDRFQVENFQRHERKRIKLDPQITAVVGPTDTGKSSLLRAFRWLVMNRPRGDGFVRHGAKDASVMVRCDGVTVKRSKGKSGNTYEVDGKPLEAFGTDVPEEVTNLLRLDEVNFQGQHEAPFWFSLTAGEVAKRLNAIVDLGLIDEVTGQLTSMGRKAKVERDVVAKRLETAKEEAEEMSFVPKLEGDLSKLEKLKEEADHQAALVADLGAIVDQAESYGERAKRALGEATDGQGVLSLGREALEVDRMVAQLGRVVEEIKIQRDLVGREVPDMGPLEKFRVKLDAGIIEVEELESVVENTQRLRVVVMEASVDLDHAQQVLDEETGGLCPVCGGLLK